MPRPFSAAMTAQITGSYLRPAFFAQLHFLSGDVFVWSGIGTVNWNGHDFLGLGQFGQISTIEESNDIKANNLTLTLSGVPSDSLSQALNETRQGNAVTLWFGCVGDGGDVVADPVKSFAGRMDVPLIEEGATTCTISITVESILVDLQRSRLRSYTHEDQQIDFPGDLGFEYVPGLQDWNGVWGKPGSHHGAPIHIGTGGGPGRGGNGGGSGRGFRPNN